MLSSLTICSHIVDLYNTINTSKERERDIVIGNVRSQEWMSHQVTWNSHKPPFTLTLMSTCAAASKTPWKSMLGKCNRAIKCNQR